MSNLALTHLLFAKHHDVGISIGRGLVEVWVDAAMDHVHFQGFQCGFGLCRLAHAGFVARHESGEATA